MAESTMATGAARRCRRDARASFDSTGPDPANPDSRRGPDSSIDL